MKINDGITVGAGYSAPGYSAFKNCKGENIGDPSHTVTNSDGGGAGLLQSLQTGTWDVGRTPSSWRWSSGSASATRSRPPSRSA